MAICLLAAAWPALAQEEGTTPAETERWRLTIDRLRNGHYPLPLCSADDGTPIRLQEDPRGDWRSIAWLNVSEAWRAWLNGEATESPRTGIPQAVGLIGDQTAFGDLDGDRTAEAVVVAFYNGGGSGTW